MNPKCRKGTHLDATCEQLSRAVEEPSDAEHAAHATARRQLATCDNKLARYRAALESGTDPEVIAAWTTQVQGERLVAERALAANAPRAPITADDLRAAAAELGDFRQVLAAADPVEKTDLYAGLGVDLTYRPTEQLVAVEASPCAAGRVGGGTRGLTPPARLLRNVALAAG